MSLLFPTIHGPHVLPATVSKYSGMTLDEAKRIGPRLVMAFRIAGKIGERTDNIPQPKNRELSPEAREKKRAYNLIYGKARRDKFRSMGLTSAGAQRRKPCHVQDKTSQTTEPRQQKTVMG